MFCTGEIGGCRTFATGRTLMRSFACLARVGAQFTTFGFVCDCLCTFWAQETGWKPALRACGSAGRRGVNYGGLGGMGEGAS